jgi:hypothetical protein
MSDNRHVAKFDLEGKSLQQLWQNKTVITAWGKAASARNRRYKTKAYLLFG